MTNALRYNSVVNPLTTDDTFLASLDFGHMLTAGAIHFEDRFCASRKVGQGEVGGSTTLPDSAWWWLQLPVEKSWSMTGGPSVCLLAQNGCKKHSFHLDEITASGNARAFKRHS